ncbi:MAG: class I SAM-dependent methyltransferase, partial [Terracidiphilus sp.]
MNAYIQHGHHLVKGWLLPGAIEATVRLSAEQRKAGVSSGIAEIGVHHGRLFILLYLLGTADESAVAIDLFSHQDLNNDRSGAGDLERFKRNLKRHANLDRLVIHEGDSMQLTSDSIAELGRGPFRMISIDGGHSPEITAHDLSVSEAALVSGGVILLDDCFNEAWPGVSNGVHQYFSELRSVVPFGIGGGKTFFCHRPFADRYAATLIAMDPKAVSREFLGSQVVC